MNIFEIAIRVALVVFALYLLNQLYILARVYPWQSQDKLIARALERQDV